MLNGRSQNWNFRASSEPKICAVIFLEVHLRNSYDLSGILVDEGIILNIFDPVLENICEFENFKLIIPEYLETIDQWIKHW